MERMMDESASRRGAAPQGSDVGGSSKGTVYHTPNADADIVEAVQLAAEQVYAVPFRRKVRSFGWFWRRIRGSS